MHLVLLVVILSGANLARAASNRSPEEHAEIWMDVATEQASVLNAGYRVKYEMRQVIPEKSPWSSEPAQPVIRATQTIVRGEGRRWDYEEIWDAGGEKEIVSRITAAWNYNQGITIRHAKQSATIGRVGLPMIFDDFSPLKYHEFGGALWPDAYDIYHVYEGARLVDGDLQITFSNKYNDVDRYRYYVDTSNYAIKRYERLRGDHIEWARVYADYRMVDDRFPYPFSQTKYMFGDQPLERFDPSLAYRRYDILIQEATFAPDIPDGFFCPLPPTGYAVVDVLHNIRYVQGQLKDADAVLDAQVEALVTYQAENLAPEILEAHSEGAAEVLEEEPAAEAVFPPGKPSPVEEPPRARERGLGSTLWVIIFVSAVVVAVIVTIMLKRRRKS